jgi:predicted nucleic acid-binding protein
MNYLDTSALIKRFVAERGSGLVDALVLNGPPVATAKIAYAEVHSGLARKRREGHLPETGYLSACRLLEAEWRTCIQVELTDEVLRVARDVIRRRALRGFDAIHVASALELKKRLNETMTFAASDRSLLRAARSEGLAPLDVEAGAS